MSTQKSALEKRWTPQKTVDCGLEPWTNSLDKGNSKNTSTSCSKRHVDAGRPQTICCWLVRQGLAKPPWHQSSPLKWAPIFTSLPVLHSNVLATWRRFSPNSNQMMSCSSMKYTDCLAVSKRSCIQQWKIFRSTLLLAKVLRRHPYDLRCQGLL